MLEPHTYIQWKLNRVFTSCLDKGEGKFSEGDTMCSSHIGTFNGNKTGIHLVPLQGWIKNLR